jgi:hypothetical protein
MNREKIIILVAMAVAVLMVLFPPWSVRSNVSWKDDITFGPEHAGAYAFIAAPPNVIDAYYRDKYEGFPNGLVTEAATVDLSRLLLQFASLALVTGGAIFSLRTPRDQQHTAHSGERETNLRAA